MGAFEDGSALVAAMCETDIVRKVLLDLVWALHCLVSCSHQYSVLVRRNLRKRVAAGQALSVAQCWIASPVLLSLAQLAHFEWLDVQIIVS